MKQFLYNSKNQKKINQAPSSKPRKSIKRTPKPKSEIQKIISLEEHKQPPRRLVKLEEYMANLQLNIKIPEKEVSKKTCRTISIQENFNEENLQPQRKACCIIETSIDSKENLCFIEKKPTKKEKKKHKEAMS